MNPISLQTRVPVHLDNSATAAIHLAPDPRDAHLRETMPAYLIAGKYLLTRSGAPCAHNLAQEVSQCRAAPALHACNVPWGVEDKYVPEFDV